MKRKIKQSQCFSFCLQFPLCRQKTNDVKNSPVLELAEDGVCRCGEEYADESKLRGAEGDGGNMQE